MCIKEIRRAWSGYLCVLKFISLKGDRGGGGGLWEVIRSRGQNPGDWDQCLDESDPRELAHPFRQARTQQKGEVHDPKRDPQKTSVP